MKKRFRLIPHSMKMVRRTLRSYALLSVTIILSFTLLLGYMGYVDSTIYNENKYIFKINRGNMKIEEAGNKEAFEILLHKLTSRQDTCFYTVNHAWVFMSDGSFITSNGNTLPAREMDFCFLTGYVWEFFFHLGDRYPIRWIDEKMHSSVNLRQEEAILDLATFNALGLGESDNPTYTFRLHTAEYTKELSVKIVGVMDLGSSFFTDDGNGVSYNTQYTPMLILNDNAVSSEDLTAMNASRYVVIYSENPEEIYALSRSLGFDPALGDSVYRWQDSVREVIQTKNTTKALITCAMLLILGINLFSSFRNALNARTLEIGIKRAIGASAFSIVRQFFYESVVVMAVNIFVSIVLVVDLGILYRYIIENALGKTDFRFECFTLYLSSYSIFMFLVCAFSMTSVFSLIFAYQSTRIQVIQQLKSE